MKKFYKNTIRRNYENLSLILNGKTNYLRNLTNRRDNGLKIIKEQKTGIIIEDILKVNTIKRDYSCCPINSSTYDEIIPLKVHFIQDVKYPIKSKIEKENSKKKINGHFEDIPINNNNYYEFPKSNLPIRFNNNLYNHKNKILANVGKEIIMKRSLSNNRDKSL